MVGRAGEPGTEALLDVLRVRYLPNTVLAPADPGAAAGAGEQLPLLQGRTPVGGRAAAYVCERYACRRPVTAAAELAEMLDGSAASPGA